MFRLHEAQQGRVSHSSMICFEYSQLFRKALASVTCFCQWIWQRHRHRAELEERGKKTQDGSGKRKLSLGLVGCLGGGGIPNVIIKSQPSARELLPHRYSHLTSGSGKERKIPLLPSTKVNPEARKCEWQAASLCQAACL